MFAVHGPDKTNDINLMNQREAVLQRSRSARLAFHSRGTSAMAQCRFILTVGRL